MVTMNNANVLKLIALYASLRNLIVTAVIVANDRVPTASHWQIPATMVCFNLQTADGTIVNPLPIGISNRGAFVIPGLASYPSSMNPPLSASQPVTRNAFKGMWDVALWLDFFVAGYRQRATASVAGFPATAPALAAPAPAPALTELDKVDTSVSPETGKDTAKLTAEITGKRK